MSWFACRTDFEHDVDYGDCDERREASMYGAIEADGPEEAEEVASATLRPLGYGWSAVASMAIACDDRGEAVRRAREMEWMDRRGWLDGR